MNRKTESRYMIAETLTAHKKYFSLISMLLATLLTLHCDSTFGNNSNKESSGSTFSSSSSSSSSSLSSSSSTSLDEESESGEFSIIVIPDTQQYFTYWSKVGMFDDQINWIIASREEYSTAFVAHLGDMIGSYSVEGVSEKEWEYFKSGMDRLTENAITYGVVPGNHDYVRGTRDATMFNHYLPLNPTFTSMKTYGGSFEPGQSENTYHTFEAAGIKVLVLLLEFGPRDTVLTWAAHITESHSDHMTIVVTHGYMNYLDQRLGAGMRHSPTNGYGLSTDANNGEDMWNTFISQHANIRFVLCGHSGSSTDGAGFLESVGVHGNSVYQMLSNYQYYNFSQSGYIRVLKFINGDTLRLDVLSYNPSYEKYHTDPEHAFSVVIK